MVKDFSVIMSAWSNSQTSAPLNASSSSSSSPAPAGPPDIGTDRHSSPLPFYLPLHLSLSLPSSIPLSLSKPIPSPFVHFYSYFYVYFYLHLYLGNMNPHLHIPHTFIHCFQKLDSQHSLILIFHFNFNF